MGKAVRKTLFSLTALLLAALLCFSGWQLFLAISAYHREDAIKQEMLACKPESETVENAEHRPHSGLEKAKSMNPDVVGWICIPGTGVDYAFVQTGNNSDYLRKDLHGEYSVAGTVFLDCRNGPDFTDDKTIMYGHNLQNGGMFGDLENYLDKAFLEGHKQIEIFIEKECLIYEVFACFEAEPDDEELYNLIATSGTNEKPILVLSTCLGTSGAKRLVVLAQLV